MKLCQIYNIGPHYRSALFKLMDAEFHGDFIFGDENLSIKLMNYNELKCTRIIHVKKFKHCFIQKGLVSLLHKKYEYDTFLVTGDCRNISLWMLLLLNIFYKKRIYLWSHGWYGKESKLKKIITRFFYSLATGAFIYNNYSRNLMIKGGISADKLYVIYNSLDYNNQLKLRRNLSPSDIYKQYFQNNNPVLICICRLEFRKRLDLLFEALYILKTRGELFNVVLIGDGKDCARLKSLVQEKNIESNVWFYGACYDEFENANLLYNANLCVVPGDIGLTAIHSMMYGTPVLTHNCYSNHGPEFETIQEGKTGLFFEHNNANDLANKISDWFSIYLKTNSFIKQQCYNEIDTKWNLNYQMKIFKNVFYNK